VPPGESKYQRFAMRQIPVGFVHPRCRLYIGPGSEVNPDVLAEELNLLQQAGYDNIRERLFVSPQATWLTPEHIEAETTSAQTIGSTRKGIGACRADRIRRSAKLIAQCPSIGDLIPEGNLFELHEQINAVTNERVVVEGTQGYGLGLHAGFYPQCTSSDCRAIDMLAMSGVSPWGHKGCLTNIHLVIRPFPIRIAGNSGPLQGETSWAELGLPVEYTTVTQKPRRVGTFDPELVERAIRANGAANVSLHLAMADQIVPSAKFMQTYHDLKVLAAADRAKLVSFLQSIPFNWRIRSLGTGPHTEVWLSENQLEDLYTKASWESTAQANAPSPS
jgi:adenylosuccinate synthase